MAARLDYATYRMEGFVVEEPHPFPSPWPCFRVAAQKQQHGFVRGASRGGLFHSLLGVGCTLGHCAKLDLSNLSHIFRTRIARCPQRQRVPRNPSRFSTFPSADGCIFPSTRPGYWSLVLLSPPCASFVCTPIESWMAAMRRHIP